MNKLLIIYLLLQLTVVGVLRAAGGPPTNQVYVICEGSIKTLTAPDGLTAYQWFKDGVLFATTASINVNATGKYELVGFSDKGCASDVSPAIYIKVAPIPGAPVLSVTQPTCALATGSISVSSLDSATYSKDGGISWQPSNVFDNLIAGNYSIIIKSVSGCTSPITIGSINNQPPTPDAPVVKVTQPDCVFATGTVQVIPPDDTSAYTYSINGGPFLQGDTFPELKPGTYTVYIKNSFGCVSNGTTVELIKEDPTGDFTASATNIAYGNAVTFTEQVPGGVTYKWDFGDGSTSTALNPVHFYYHSGAFTVTLTTITSGGCDYTITKAGYIQVANDTYNPTPPVISVPEAPVYQNSKFVAYPNPFQDHFYVSFDATISQSIRVTLMDLRGNLLFDKTFSAAIGTNIFEVNKLPAMATGYYLLTVQGQTIKEELKLLKN